MLLNIINCHVHNGKVEIIWTVKRNDCIEWVQCSQCLTWQHLHCLKVDYVEENYLCPLLCGNYMDIKEILHRNIIIDQIPKKHINKDKWRIY